MISNVKRHPGRLVSVRSANLLWHAGLKEGPPGGRHNSIPVFIFLPRVQSAHFFFFPFLSSQKQQRNLVTLSPAHRLCDLYLEYVAKIERLIVSAARFNSVNHDSSSFVSVFVETRSSPRPLHRCFAVLIPTADTFLRYVTVLKQ